MTVIVGRGSRLDKLRKNRLRVKWLYFLSVKGVISMVFIQCSFKWSENHFFFISLTHSLIYFVRPFILLNGYTIWHPKQTMVPMMGPGPCLPRSVETWYLFHVGANTGDVETCYFHFCHFKLKIPFESVA